MHWIIELKLLRPNACMASLYNYMKSFTHFHMHGRTLKLLPQALYYKFMMTSKPFPQPSKEFQDLSDLIRDLSRAFL